MRKVLAETTKEALSSVLPITAVVFLLSITITPVPIGTLALFLFGALLLVLGMGLFTMGVDMSMLLIGEDIGKKMTLTRKAGIAAIVSFTMGLIITIAEPDLQVLADLVPGIPNSVLVFTVSAGVGIFLVLAIFRILLRISLPKLLIACYLFVILLSFVTPRDFLPVAFDSGGVTTGPITVPFILSMGLGLAAVRGDRGSAEDSFGLVSLCSVGPILAVMLLGVFYEPSGAADVRRVIPDIVTSRDMALEFTHSLPHFFIDVSRSLWPVLGVAVLFQILTRRYRRRQFVRILIGYLYTFLGLIVFMTGVNVGFIPVGQVMGSELLRTKWLIIPLGALIGYTIVAAEPAVHVLRKQVEEVSGGGIPGRVVQRYLSVGTAAALSAAMLRVLTGISLYWFLIPGYGIALILTLHVPKIFSGIAFDAGGVVSGPMTSTFLLPFAIGACADPDRVMYDAFGLVAMVAMAPLVSIQLMGIRYKKKVDVKTGADLSPASYDEILEYEEAATDAD